MALFDLQPVDLANGERLLPNALIKVVIASDKQLPSNQTSKETEMNFRRAFKTDQVEVVAAKCEEVEHELDHRSPVYPSSLIKAVTKTQEEIENTIEYDVDEEDLIWLDEENKRRQLKKMKKIKDEMFEQTIDRLEKETYFKNDAASSMDGSEQLDDDCCICGNGDVENVNQIIYCDMCNIAVHQDCYGVPYIPDGQWLCRKCKLSPMESVKCELCPLKDGAFKPTTDGKWAHVACAIWLNEVHFGNTAFLEPIDGVQESLRRRRKLRCLVCKVKMGACLQCSKGSCVKSFHVTCAMKARLQMTVNTIENTKSPDGVDVKRFVYCHVHGSIAVGENEFAKNKKRAIEAIQRARRKMNTAGASMSAPVPTVDLEARKRIEDTVGDKNVVEEIMGFWFYKRKMRFGIPLIRRLQAKKKKIVRVPTPRGEAKRRGRIMYEKARLLIELVQKRERNYIDNIVAQRRMTAHLLAPFENILVDFIKSLIPMDSSEFFKSDPTKQKLANYLSIVKKPMDLTTMKHNAQKGIYKTERDMKEHLDLIFNNCVLYNKNNAGVVLYANETQKMMNKAYDDLVAYLKYLNTWKDERKLNEEKKSRLVDEERIKEEKKELKDAQRDEPNKRKRKADEVKVEEDVPEIPTVKRDKKARDKDKDKEPPANKVMSSIFAHSTVHPNQRRFSSFDNAKLDSNSNKSPRRRLPRQLTQPAFNTFRESSVLSPPEAGPPSCESVEYESESSRPDSRSISRSTMSDPNALHHNDLVKVKGTAARIIILSHESIENPEMMKLYRDVLRPRSHDEVLVHHFSSHGKNGYARYDVSQIAPLDLDTDKVEGIDEARTYKNLRMIGV